MYKTNYKILLSLAAVALLFTVLISGFSFSGFEIQVHDNYYVVEPIYFGLLVWVFLIIMFVLVLGFENRYLIIAGCFFAAVLTSLAIDVLETMRYFMDSLMEGTALQGMTDLQSKVTMLAIAEVILILVLFFLIGRMALTVRRLLHPRTTPSESERRS